MSTEGTPQDPLARLPISREAIGQIRFDPSEALLDRLTDLYLPVKREVARRALFLSSQYKIIAQYGPGGVAQGEEGQLAERLDRALKPGVNSQNHLGRYMRQATVDRNGREFFALQFAVHLHPQIVSRIESDEKLSEELIFPRRDRVIKAFLAYDAEYILDGKRRDAAVRNIGKFVVGSEIMPHDGGEEGQLSQQPHAYVTNLRFRFSSPHSKTSM